MLEEYNKKRNFVRTPEPKSGNEYNPEIIKANL